MKKPYVKPQILVENFALTQQIAKCNAVRISMNDRACVFKDPDSSPEMKQIAAAGGFNTMGNRGCDWMPTYQSGDGLCYFSNMHMVFSS